MAGAAESGLRLMKSDMVVLRDDTDPWWLSRRAEYCTWTVCFGTDLMGSSKLLVGILDGLEPPRGLGETNGLAAGILNLFDAPSRGPGETVGPLGGVRNGFATS